MKHVIGCVASIKIKSNFPLYTVITCVIAEMTVMIRLCRRLLAVWIRTIHYGILYANINRDLYTHLGEVEGEI